MTGSMIWHKVGTKFPLDGAALVCTVFGEIAIAYFSHHRCGWVHTDGSNSLYADGEVVAWTELPKPYKEEE